MKLWNLFIRILKDESGIAPLLGGALLTGGSTLLGGLFGKKKQKVYDPYEKLRGDWKEWMGSKLGTTTPYEYNEAFTLDQPPVEAATEKGILGGLSQDPSQRKADYSDIYQQYYDVSKERLGREEEEQLIKTRNMYNKLGLVSSTPGLTAEQDVRDEYGLQAQELDAELRREGIQNEMAAEALAEEIYNQYISQGQVLGQQQRGYQQWGHEMSMQDIIRMIEEEMGYGQLAGGVLGGNPPQVSYDPNWALQLAQGGQDIGTMLMMSGLLGGKGGAKKGS